MIAIAVGTGVGINTVMAAKLGLEQEEEAREYAGVGTPLAIVLWATFAAVCYALIPAFARMSTDSPEIIDDVINIDLAGRNAIDQALIVLDIGNDLRQLIQRSIVAVCQCI